jgi:hypothetical protein
MFRALALVTALLAPVSAGAATLGTFTNDYDTSVDTDGGNAGTYVQLVDVLANGQTALTDSFDISSLAGQIIEELVLTITFSDGFGFLPSTSQWFLDVYGSNPTSLTDDLSVELVETNPGGLSTVTVTADASSGDAFTTAVNTLNVGFGFRETTGGIFDFIRIYDAALVVNGTATVPLPAPILLLLLGLGVLAWPRRKRAELA